MTVSEDPSDIPAVPMAVEAVVESEPVKRELLAELGRRLPADALIATTTSSLSISQLAGVQRQAGAVLRPARLQPGRPHAAGGALLSRPRPVPTPARGPSPSARAIGKTAVEVPDEPGFVVNRLLFPYLFDAVRLLERTGLEPEAIDACMKLGASHPMGPLELLDLVGIDVAEAIGEALHADTGDAAHRPPGRIKDARAAGQAGPQVRRRLLRLQLTA